MVAQGATAYRAVQSAVDPARGLRQTRRRYLAAYLHYHHPRGAGLGELGSALDRCGLRVLGGGIAAAGGMVLGFGGVRPEMWILLPTGIGIGAGLIRQQFDLSILATKKNLFVLILWFCFALSYYFGVYTQVPGPYRFDNADDIFSLSNKD